MVVPGNTGDVPYVCYGPDASVTKRNLGKRCVWCVQRKKHEICGSGDFHGVVLHKPQRGPRNVSGSVFHASRSPSLALAPVLPRATPRGAVWGGRGSLAWRSGQLCQTRDTYGIRQRCTWHPPAAVFQARLLDDQEGANTERHVVFGKLPTRCLQPRPFRHPHHSNCEDIEQGKSVQGGMIVWYAPLYTVAVKIQNETTALLQSFMSYQVLVLIN